MNEELKALLAKQKMDGNLRTRLNKIFDKSCPVTCIDLRGYEHGKRLNIRKEDLSTLLQICGEISTLQSLTISGHELDDSSALVLAEAIVNMKTLEALNIDSSSIGEQGAIEIVKAIGRHGGIRYVCLHGDGIGNLAADAIAIVVTNNPYITRLSVQWKFISN